MTKLRKTFDGRGVRRPIENGQMICLICKEWRPLSEFYPHLNRSNGYTHRDSRCDSCRKLTMIGRRVGLTVHQVIELRRASNGKCALCKEPYSRPYIDHDHTTKHVRGILCPRCNTGLGGFRDDTNLLEAAIDYLTGSRTSPVESRISRESSGND